MPLTPAQLTGITDIAGGDIPADTAKLYIPAGYVGPINAARLANTVSRACWNWALCGSAQNNPDAPSSPVVLYEENAPVDYRDGQPRPAFAHVFPGEPGIGALWLAARNASAPAAAARERFADARADARAAARVAAANGATAATTRAAAAAERRAAEAEAAAARASAIDDVNAAALGDRDPRKLFMAAMAREAARRNGLQPQAHFSPYKIHVTAPLADWYHWQHWALSITHNGRTRFIQTEPNRSIEWGHTRIWEANRDGHIDASFYIADLLPAHIEVIECFLRMPRCRLCNKVKPRTTTFSTRWHECTAAAPHHYCGPCGARLVWNGGNYIGRLRRTRRCSAVACGHETTLLGDS
ncbi:hypothetical protein [Trinickia acidisoli]|uniref:hypothetical protein n=1 Tax=Trinickia acidisoli TaxID=2767482 RepID=UPI001A8E2604|nr:hypothetical protein [Trinickia acidisoli]